MEYKSVGSVDYDKVKAKYYGYGIIGNPPNQTSRRSATASIYTSSTLVGSSRQSVVPIKTGPYRPGRVKLCPIEHWKAVTESVPCARTLVYTTLTGNLLPIGEVEGHVAALVAYQAPTSFPVLPTGLSAHEGVVYNRAVAASKEAAADVGMMLAEAGRTVAMICQPLRLLPRALKVLIRPRTFGRHQMFRRGTPLSYAKDAWLTHRYGILPLLGDIDDLRHLTRDVLAPRHFDFRRRRAKKTLSSTSVRTAITGLRPVPMSLYGQMVTTSDVTVYASAFYRADGQTTGAQLGIDASSVPTLLWELVPFSFVVDWWLDVGTWIRAITPKFGITSLGGITSVQARSTIDVSLNLACHISPNSYYPLSGLTSTCTTVSTRYVRSLATHPVHNFVLKPGLASWQRKVSATALAFQPVTDLMKKITR